MKSKIRLKLKSLRPSKIPTEFPLTLPEGPADLLRQSYPEAQAIIEYGSGGSTIIAAQSGKPCVSVESDAMWSAALHSKISETYGAASLVELLHIDIGPTGKWGYPEDFSGVQNYWKYPTQVWTSDIVPQVDTVLIDGRMRVACFAATLLNIQNPTTILFDDYANRPEYHLVEQFLKPAQIVDRMAVFEAIPGLLKPEDFMVILPWFSIMR